MQHAIVCDRATIERDRAPPEAVQEACTPRRRAQTPAARRGTSTRTRCAPPAACATRGMRRPRRCASRRAAAWRCSSSLPLRTAGRRCRTCGTAAAGCAAERSGRCSASRSCPRGTLAAACFRGARPFPSRGVGVDVRILSLDSPIKLTSVRTFSPPDIRSSQSFPSSELPTTSAGMRFLTALVLLLQPADGLLLSAATRAPVARSAGLALSPLAVPRSSIIHMGRVCAP